MLRWLVAVGQELGQGLLHLCYPGICLLCEHPLSKDHSDFCGSCTTELFEDHSEVCPRCAGTVGPYSVVQGRCVHCRTETFAFDRVVRLGRYSGALKQAILRIKHARGEGLAELLGERWARHALVAFHELELNGIVPVPLHWRRRLERGYNQSASLAYGLASRLGIPCWSRTLRRVRYTPSQRHQTSEGRRENVRDAFAVRRGVDLSEKSILLVDDVMTTGATVSEAAGALRAAGAARVVVAVLARAQGNLVA